MIYEPILYIGLTTFGKLSNLKSMFRTVVIANPSHRGCPQTL